MKIRRLFLGAFSLALLALMALWLFLRDIPHQPDLPPAHPTASRAPEPASTRHGPVPLPGNAGSAGPADRPTVPDSTVGSDDPLAARGVVEGLVLSLGSGVGVPDAELTFSRGGAVAIAKTNASGAFTFEPPEPGKYRLAAVSAQDFLPFAPEWGHSPIAVTAIAGKRIKGVVLYLTPAVEYVGTVVDPAGKPVAGAEVRVLGGGGGEQVLLRMNEHYVSDPAGEFRFHAPDHAVLEARHPRFEPGRAALDFSAQVSHRLTLRLGVLSQGPATRRGSIAGQVLDAQGHGLEGARVVARREDAGDDASLTVPTETATGDDGHFRLDGLDAGRYRVTAFREGLAPTQASGVEVQTLDLLLRMSSGGSLAGSVVDAATGQPIAGYVVHAWRHSEDFLRLESVAETTILNPDGKYELTGLPVGRLVVTVSSRGYAPPPETEVEIKADPAPAASLDFRLSPGARLNGQVVERGSRTPLVGARVTVQTQRGRREAGPAASTLLTALTEQGGTFSLKGLAAGEISLLVAASDHHGRIFGPVRIPQQGEAPPIVIELSPTRPGEAPRLELVGIGVVLVPKGEHLEIQRVLEGGGASEAGLRAGDLVLAVDGRPVSQLGFDGALNAIRGLEGTSVALTLRRADAVPMQVVVLRRLIQN